MPHDLNRRQISDGDMILLRGVVKAVHSGEGGCNCNVTIQNGAGEVYQPEVVMNTKGVEVIKPASETLRNVLPSFGSKAGGIWLEEGVDVVHLNPIVDKLGAGAVIGSIAGFDGVSLALHLNSNEPFKLRIADRTGAIQLRDVTADQVKDGLLRFLEQLKAITD